MIIFDTETTGLIDNMAKPLKDQPQIIELYALKLDDGTLGVVGEWHSLFHVQELPDEIVGITGITKDMLKDAPSFTAMFSSLAEFFLGELVLAGHNLSFDRDMLVLELRRLGKLFNFPWPTRHICTVECSEAINGYRMSLQDLHTHLTGEAFESAHRAKADVTATAACMRELVKSGAVVL